MTPIEKLEKLLAEAKFTRLVVDNPDNEADGFRIHDFPEEPSWIASYLAGDLDEATANLFAEAVNALPALLAALRTQGERITKLEEALTPSAETKAAYIGEFSLKFPEFDADGEEHMRSINVPWDTVKEIMAAIRARTLLES